MKLCEGCILASRQIGLPSKPVYKKVSRHPSDCVTVMVGLSSGADPSAAPSTIGSAVVTFSLASKELDSAHTTQLPDQKAVGPRLQKAKQLVEGNITPW